MKLELEDAWECKIRYVVWRARPWNAREMRMQLGPSYREQAVRYMNLKGNPKYIVTADGWPMCSFGMVEVADGDFWLYMVATETVEQCGQSLARILKRTYRRWVGDVRPMSVRCKALAGNPKSNRWFDFLGAVQERQSGLFEIYTFPVT